MNTFLISACLFAGALQDDVWKSLRLGDRVQVTFRSGGQITGQLVVKPADPRVKVTEVDFAQSQEITVSLTYEYPGLNGSMTIPRKEIRDLKKLQALDAATLKRLDEEQRRYQADQVAQEAARKADEDRRTKEGQAARTAAEKEDEARKGAVSQGADLVKKAERLKEGLAMLAKFPPPDWGAKRLEQIAQKSQSKLPITPDELEFQKNIGLWQEALAYSQQDKKGVENKEGDPKPAPATAPSSAPQK